MEPQTQTQDLNLLYKQTIDAQRQHLLELQTQFNEKCDVIKVEAKKRIGGAAPEDSGARDQALTWQKAELEKALAWLKTAVHESTRDTMKKLEEVQRKREAQLLTSIETQIQSL